MAKRHYETTITVHYGTEDFKLGFTADTLKRLQNQGFNFADMESRVLTVEEDLFCGAFLAYHPNVMRKKRIEIYHDLVATSEDGEELMDVLMEMVNETIEEINYHEGNTKWEVNR